MREICTSGSTRGRAPADFSQAPLYSTGSISFGQIIATVGDQEISEDAVYGAAARGAYDLTDPESARKALEDVVTFELLAAEAKRLGYDKDPKVVEQLKRTIVQKLVAEKIDKDLPRTILAEDDLTSYFDSHPEEFSKPGLVKGQLIMVLVKDGNLEDGRKKIEEASQLLKDGTSFQEVVKSHSDDIASRATGGVTNWIIEDKESKRYPREIIDVLFNTDDKSEIHGPIKTEKAYYLAKLVEKRPGRVIDYEDARKGISSKVYRAKRQQAYNAYCEQLKSQFPVKVDEAGLGKLVDKAANLDGPPMGPVSVKRKTD